MAKKVSTKRELIRATNISRRRKSESEQAYFNRIVLEVGGLSNDARASLSPEAKLGKPAHSKPSIRAMSYQAR
jgi:hypothetical protein